VALLVVAALVWWRSFVRRLRLSSSTSTQLCARAAAKARHATSPRRSRPSWRRKRCPTDFRLAGLVRRTGRGCGVHRGLAVAGLHGPVVMRMIVILVLVASVVAIYQRIALQEILRPLFRHLGSRHLLPPDQVRSPVGLRLKLAVFFLGVWGFGVGFLWLFQQAAPSGSARFALAIGIVLAAGVVLFAVREVVVPCALWRSVRGNVKGATRPTGPSLGRSRRAGAPGRDLRGDAALAARPAAFDRVINVDLEREVRRRTEALEQRNAELHDALEKLRRAQDNLVRSEKLASMAGWLRESHTKSTIRSTP